MGYNDKVVIEFTPQQEQVVIGTLFGDGSLQRLKTETRNSRLRVTHKEADKEYLFWKYNLLRPSGVFLRPPSYRFNHKGFGSWYFQSRHLPIFTAYRRVFYPNGIKVVPLEMLDKLELLGLAVWYMDDGSLSKHKKHVDFSVEGFGLTGVNIIRKWFEERFGLQPVLVSTGNSNIVRLRFNVEGSKKLQELVRLYVEEVKCMGRKIRK